MKLQYIHEDPDWPRFRWDSAALADCLAEVRHRQGRFIGRMGSLGFDLRQEAVLESLTQDVQKSSEIEGERLDRDQVRSSIARRLGLDIGGLPDVDRQVEGVVEMTLDATRNYAKPMTAERLFDWHASLFPTGRSGMRWITIGGWRDDSKGPMRVVSGPIGRERIHYEAPAASRLNLEMELFLDWFQGNQAVDPVMKAGIAHLWFVLIHPFEDGNGRIARAIADMALARSEGTEQRFYSMSAQVRLERKTYYSILDQTGRGGLDVTPWLTWFLNCLDLSIVASEKTLSAVLGKARFWDAQRNASLNERQQIMVNRLLDGFKGKLTSTKWAQLTKTSQDTAYRDILDLMSKGILMKETGGGRSTSYVLAERAGRVS